MKKPKQPRIWVWVILARYSPEDPWRAEEVSTVDAPHRAHSYVVSNGPRNVRVRRVEVKP